MSRPYLAGQTYTVDVDDAYLDAAPDDGSFFDHVLTELIKVILLDSRQVEAHPKIKSFPFKGAYRLHIIVRPPPRPATGAVRLVVSFRLTTRSGCRVQVTAPPNDRVDVLISPNDAEYAPPKLPARSERTYSRSELDKLSSGSGIRILLLDAIATAVAGAVPLIGPALRIYVAYILSRGILTDEYARLPESDILDATGAVIDAPVNNIPHDQGIVLDNDQPYPVSGRLEARWVAVPSRAAANTPRALKKSPTR